MSTRTALLAIVIASSAVLACGSSDSSGGSKSDGGAGAGSGGTAGSGGNAGASGTSGTGGSAGSGATGGAAGSSGTGGASGSAGADAGFDCKLASSGCQDCIKASCLNEAGACQGNATCKSLNDPFATCLCNAQLGIGAMQDCIDTFENGGGQPATALVTCANSNCATDCGL